MGVNYSTLILLPNYEFFARDITVTPVVSQPGVPAYAARGIYDTEVIEIPGDGMSIITDQRTILDVREIEFGVVPVQGDLIAIGPDGDNPDLGSFDVIDAWTNGGGETTLVLRQIVPAYP